jgi:hypothetical protein
VAEIKGIGQSASLETGGPIVKGSFEQTAQFRGFD